MLQLLNFIAALGALSCDAPISLRSGSESNMNVYILERVSCEPRDRMDACLRAARTRLLEKKCHKKKEDWKAGEHPCGNVIDTSQKRECVPSCKMRVREVVRGPAVSTMYVMHCSAAVDERTSTYLYVTPKDVENGHEVTVTSCYLPGNWRGPEKLLRMEDEESFQSSVEYWRTLAGFRDGVCLEDLIRYVVSGTAGEREAAMSAIPLVDWSGEVRFDAIAEAMVLAPPVAFHGPTYRRYYSGRKRAYLARQRRRRTATGDLKGMVEHLLKAHTALAAQAPSSDAFRYVCASIRQVHGARVAGLPDLAEAIEACSDVAMPD